MAIIPALRRLRQENHEFKGSQGYIMRLCLVREKREENEEEIMKRRLNPEQSRGRERPPSG
jgi:hypothetical protein